jgi:hypothetical protein
MEIASALLVATALVNQLLPKFSLVKISLLVVAFSALAKLVICHKILALAKIKEPRSIVFYLLVISIRLQLVWLK